MEIWVQFSEIMDMGIVIFFGVYILELVIVVFDVMLQLDGLIVLLLLDGELFLDQVYIFSFFIVFIDCIGNLFEQ